MYCLTAGMAKKAVSTLLQEGYTNLRILAGGTTVWEEAGLGLEKQVCFLVDTVTLRKTYLAQPYPALLDPNIEKPTPTHPGASRK